MLTSKKKEKTIQEYIREMSDDELILELKSVHCSIHVVDCFSTKDLIWKELLMDEIERRGYRITSPVEIVKEEE